MEEISSKMDAVLEKSDSAEERLEMNTNHAELLTHLDRHESDISNLKQALA